ASTGNGSTYTFIDRRSSKNRPYPCIRHVLFLMSFRSFVSFVLKIKQGKKRMSDIAVERLDVIAIGPHPDDLEITCGGTLARLVKQGYKVGMIDLTTGEPTPRGSEEIRAREAEAARKVLDVPVRINLKLPNRELMDGPPARYALATELRRYRPAIIIGLAGRTPAASPDHHQGHMIVEAARFYSQLTKWNDRFGGTEPYRVPHLVYATFPFDAEQR